MWRCKRGWLEKGFGVCIDGDTQRLTNLRFADDIVLAALSFDDLTEMIGDLANHAAQFGLAIHPEKTKILGNVPDKKRTGKSGTEAVTVGDLRIQVLGYGEYAKYLGRRFSFADSDTVELGNRINIGWSKFHSLKHILCNRRYPLTHRLRLFDSTVTPSVLYGCESWTMTAEHQHRLRKTQRHMLRLILQTRRRRMRQDECTDTSSSSSLESCDVASSPGDADDLESWVEFIKRTTREAEIWLDKLEMKSWLETQRIRLHRWAGHVARRRDGRWSNLILDWQPEPGTRQGGTGRGRRQARPVKRWDDDLRAHVSVYTGQTDLHWRLLAEDRASWKEMEDDFAAGGWRA